MTKVGIIRCEKNMDRCPLTNCLNCLSSRKEAFADYEDCNLMGVLTCHCPGECIGELSRILKAKGADAIHFCTCTFAKKGENGWVLDEGGFCRDIDRIIEEAHNQTGLPCIKGTAHLPKNYSIRRW